MDSHMHMEHIMNSTISPIQDMGHMHHSGDSMDHSGHSMDHSGHSMDHSGHSMDHSGHSMDHSGHHGSMGHSMHDMGHMMMMYFHFGFDEVILFKFWKISSIEGLILSMVGLFVVAALYEGLKYYRDHLFWKAYNDIQYSSVEVQNQKTFENPPRSQVVNVNCVGDVNIHRSSPTMLSASHLVQTVLHVVQITVSYLLMLVFMTYNVWLCLAVVLGSATGYFLFGWKKSIVVDVTEHCH